MSFEEVVDANSGKSCQGRHFTLTAMQNGLRIPEIFANICQFALEDEALHTLSSLALVHTTFVDPALDALWNFHGRGFLIHLVMLLPSDAWRITSDNYHPKIVSFRIAWCYS
jgi:hypothetical protein